MEILLVKMVDVVVDMVSVEAMEELILLEQFHQDGQEVDLMQEIKLAVEMEELLAEAVAEALEELALEAEVLETYYLEVMEELHFLLGMEMLLAEAVAVEEIMEQQTQGELLLHH